MHYYEAFGRTIHSEVQLPDLNSSDASEPSVVIKQGNISHVPLDRSDTTVCFNALNNTIHLKLGNFVEFLVSANGTVTIQRKPSLDESLLRQLIYKNIIGIVLLLQGDFILSGSAVYSKRNKASIFLSPYSNQNTELVLLLNQYNSGVLSDGICRIFCENDRALVYRGYPFVQVWENTLEKLGLKPEHYSRVRPKLKKYKCFLDVVPDSRELESIFVLDQDRKTTSVQVTKLNTKEAIFKILRYGQKRQSLNNANITGELLQQAAFVSQNAVVHLLKYRDCFEQIEEISRALQKVAGHRFDDSPPKNGPQHSISEQHEQ